MKIKMIFFIYILWQGSLASAVEFPPAPQKNYFSTAIWQERRVLEIPEGETHLTEAADISVDEVVIRGTLVTNGFQLKMDAIQLTFEEGGKIVAFSTPAKEGDLGLIGEAGFISKATGGAGGNGLEGKEGFVGQDGHQDPGAIVIHAVKTVGIPMISGVGQAGGKGGKGGTGGKGGKGGKGEKGETNCWGYRRGGGTGGMGGQGGVGGKGGTGGKGGRPVPVIFISGNQQELSLIGIEVAEGFRGVPGEPGEPGGKGEGGEGGEGSSSDCGFWPVEWSVSSGRGGKGPSGPEQTKNLGPGLEGAMADAINDNNIFLKIFRDLAPEQPKPIVYSFDRLSQQRLNLIENWLFVHWSRNFILLVYETLAEIQSQDADVNVVMKSNDLLNMLIKNTNKERAEALALLWEGQFILPLEQGSGKDPAYFTDTEISAAKNMVEMLRLLAQEDTIAVKEQIHSLLSQMQSTAQLQFEGSLAPALDECKTYVQYLAGTDQRAVRLSPYYRVPICSGTPDMRLQKNIAAAIVLFDPWVQKVPQGLVTLTRTIASSLNIDKQDSFIVRLMKRSLQALFPKAYGDYAFEAVVDAQENSSYSELPASVPSQSWLVSGRGRIQGYKAIESNLSESEIARELRYLSESVNVLRGRQ